jgi:serine/threonine protein kinase
LIGDGEVSRHHCLLEIAPPLVNLRDLGSRNGTLVNEVRYGGRALSESREQGSQRQFESISLKHGDVIRVGKTRITVEIETPAVAVEPAPSLSNCARCGQDASAEMTTGPGEYICLACREQLMNDAPRAPVTADPLRHALQAIRERPPIDLPGYEILDKLGQGGMGIVYKARRTADNATMAIKLMLAQVAVDAQARKIFEREIAVTGQLDHPHIVRLHEHGSQRGAFYFVLEFCSGGSIESWLSKYGGKLPWKIAGPLMVQALKGLQFAHDQGIVHRDLKPQNLLLQQAERGWMVRIADFGLAKSFERAGLSGMTATGMAAGSPGYMPREQLTNYRHLDPASDVWSIAATFYSLLTGCVPRDFTPGVDPMRVVLQHDAVPIRQRDSTIPAELAAVFDRALEDDLAKRYRTVVELLRDLRPLLK